MVLLLSFVAPRLFRKEKLHGLSKYETDSHGNILVL